MICISGLFILFLLTPAAPSLGAKDTDRTISLYNIHTKDTLEIVYKRNGRYIQSALKQINYFMRDWRRDIPIKMDPELIDLIWELHSELGSTEPIHLLSGYRSKKTNEKLRKTRGGQAKFSQHILGRAADIHFPDISVRQLRNSALVRERGGVGYYPTSALPFVHVDTGRVRHWPRLPRYELAALFPRGNSKHVPSDGNRLTARDHEIAMARLSPSIKHDALVALGRIEPQRTQTQIASLSDSFETSVQVDETLVQYASLVPSPKPVSRLNEHKDKILHPSVPEPKPVSKSWFTFLIGGDRDRSDSATTAEGVRLASADPNRIPGSSPDASNRHPIPPKIVSENWARAPDFDDEHPEELSYRPFPILPMMGDSSVSEDRQLARLTPPDFEKAFIMIDEPVSFIPLRFRPGHQFAEMLWSSQFQGQAVPSLLTGEYFERPSPFPRGLQRSARN